MTTTVASRSGSSDMGPGLTHQGLIYSSDEEFLAATVPFCLDGLELDDAVLAVTTSRNVDLLHQALGDAAAQVEFVAADDWYQAPGGTLGAYYRYVDAHTVTGRHSVVRVIGEPVWHGRDALETDEWTRYESAINIAFARCPAWIVCPYDSRVLPDAVVADARRTHPHLVSGVTAQPSDRYADPAASSEAWQRELTPGPADGRQAVMRFGTDLAAVRAFVADVATALDMVPDNVERLVLAVNELATNAVRHGGGSGQVTMWRTGRSVVCDVSDNGDAAIDWYFGYLPPDQDRARGCGLWVVRQLCDLMQIEASQNGTTVRLHLNND